MKSMLVAAAAAFMLTGAASAGVPAKLVVAKDAKTAGVTLAHVKPGARGGSAPSRPCTPFGCKTMSQGWG